MIKCLSCKLEKDDSLFYASAAPGDKTYHFCKACARVTRIDNYGIAKELIASKKSTLEIPCYGCLEDKGVREYTPCQISSHLTGFWAFCKSCANERSRAARKRRNDAKLLRAELLGEESKPRKESTYKKKKRLAREKQEAEDAFNKAQRVEAAVSQMQKLKNSILEQFV